jgi:hypothetical protein
MARRPTNPYRLNPSKSLTWHMLHINRRHNANAPHPDADRPKQVVEDLSREEREALEAQQLEGVTTNEK